MSETPPVSGFQYESYCTECQRVTEHYLGTCLTCVPSPFFPKPRGELPRNETVLRNRIKRVPG